MTEPWLPSRYSAPLEDSPGSVFDRFERIIDIVWRVAFGYVLDPWQKFVLRLVTELRPDGTLRHRQFIISVGRQNGKTEIMAALALVWLLWRGNSLVIGIASDVDQAKLIYKRVRRAILPNRSLAARFKATTETRGIRTTTGGEYLVKASKSAAVQGQPIDLGAVDEVHLIKRVLWSDLVNGLGARANCIVVGITTAGDDESDLLKDLYQQFEEGSIGGAIWEAPESRIPEDDDTLWAYLLAANPSLHTGRIPRANKIKDTRSIPPSDAIRYLLNRFVTSSDAYLSLGQWAPLAGVITPPQTGATVVIERTPQWTHATLTAAWQAGDGKIETQVIASINAPSIDTLREACLAVSDRVGEFVGDGLTLGRLIEDLKKRGLNARKSTLADHTAAASRFYARVAAGTVRHAGDALLTVQIPGTKTKYIGEHFRLVRLSREFDIDAVIGTAHAVYFAEVSPNTGLQLFV